MGNIAAFLENYWLALLLTAIAAYLLGSLNSAIIVTRLTAKEDIRQYGSGNAGATNVLRSQGKLPAVLTTLGDLAKSFVAVLIGGWLMTNWAQWVPMNELWETSAAALHETENLRLAGEYLAGFFCIIGHLFPLYFGFRGGKGILTALGMMLILDWKVALLSLLMFIIVVALSKMVSLGSVCAAATMAVLTFVFRLFVYRQETGTVIFCSCMALLIAAILILKHIPNLKRIAAGTESKLSFGSKK